MNPFRKLKNVVRGLKQSWGGARTKANLWNKEFAEGRWDFIESTEGDVIYSFVEKYSNKGSILDLGCGSGNTGCELNPDAYDKYTGVDISDVALQKAAQRSAHAGRDKKNRYVQSDIVSYRPTETCDVILFRESIYYVPRIKIKAMLSRYAGFLSKRGVFIIRWHDQKSGEEILRLFGDSFRVVEKSLAPAPAPFVVVFRAGSASAENR